MVGQEPCDLQNTVPVLRKRDVFAEQLKNVRIAGCRALSMKEKTSLLNSTFNRP